MHLQYNINTTIQYQHTPTNNAATQLKNRINTTSIQQHNKNTKRLQRRTATKMITDEVIMMQQHTNKNTTVHNTTQQYNKD